MLGRWMGVLGLLWILQGCSTPGAFFSPAKGQRFIAHDEVATDQSVVYLYRPQSRWADQELEAPALFLNNRRVGSLKSNSHMVLLFGPGSYKLEMRRPLFGSFWSLFADGPLDFTLIASFSFEMKVGERYFFRYDELNPPPKTDGFEPAGDGPLQWVAGSWGEQEIVDTFQMQSPKLIPADVYQERPQRSFWKRVGEQLEKIGI